MSALIISAFPACGKSTFYNLYQDKAVILDSDSSNFSWVCVNGVNTGVRNLEFPNNYIEHIQSKRDEADIIFVSSHQSVRKAMRDANIPYVLVYPDIALEDVWVERCINRGNSPEFVKNLQSNWQEWIESCAEDEFATKFVLRHPMNTQQDISTLNWNVVHHLLSAFRRYEEIDPESYAGEDEFKVCLNHQPLRYRAFNKESDQQLRAIWLSTSEDFNVLTFYPKEFQEIPFSERLFKAELEFANRFIAETGLLPLVKVWKLQ